MDLQEISVTWCLPAFLGVLLIAVQAHETAQDDDPLADA